MPRKHRALGIKTFLSQALAAEGFRPAIEFITMADAVDRPFQVMDRRGQYVDPSYGDYDYVYEGLQRGPEQIAHDERSESTDSEVCVDATSGLKVFSIAAAILTLNRQLKFSYVTTGADGGKLRFYEATITMVPR